eukprot:scaffold674_cov119-Isochrysis_galbana.AAC.4
MPACRRSSASGRCSTECLSESRRSWRSSRSAMSASLGETHGEPFRMPWRRRSVSGLRLVRDEPSAARVISRSR